MKISRVLIIASLLFSFGIVNAQNDQKESTLITSGTSTMTVAPDWVTVRMNLDSKSMDYSETVKDLNKQYSMLEKQLVMAGFSKDDIKTTNYTINKNVIWNNGKRIDSGYVGNQTLVLEFENDNKKIIRLVESISGGKVNVNFGFQFGLSDKKKEETRSILITKAVKDAKSKAATIAAASEINLKNIKKIEYGQLNTNHPMPMYEMKAMRADAPDSFGGFNAQEIEMSDSIVITWIIE